VVETGRVLFLSIAWKKTLVCRHHLGSDRGLKRCLRVKLALDRAASTESSAGLTSRYMEGGCEP
jgi:hypothetical protein